MNLETWLMDLGLEQYAVAFAENGIDLSLLPELTNEDLKDLGIDRLVDRKTILKAIERISESEEPPAARAPALVTNSGERRQVTVLFADIAGFTAISERLDAEATHSILNRYFAIADRIIEDFGGAVDVAPGIKLYQITEHGLALQATIQGTKYWKDDDLNS